MKSRKTRPRGGQTLTLLGGTVLFGYLGCQSPGSGSAGPVPPSDRDSSAQDTLKIIARPRPVPEVGPLVVRDGPTPGEACTEPDYGACTRDGTLLRCELGIRVETVPYQLREWFCVAGDTLVKYRHFGFTGLDKAGPPRRPPVRFARRTLA